MDLEIKPANALLALAQSALDAAAGSHDNSTFKQISFIVPT